MNAFCRRNFVPTKLYPFSFAPTSQSQITRTSAKMPRYGANVDAIWIRTGHIPLKVIEQILEDYSITLSWAYQHLMLFGRRRSGTNVIPLAPSCQGFFPKFFTKSAGACNRLKSCLKCLQDAFLCLLQRCHFLEAKEIRCARVCVTMKCT